MPSFSVRIPGKPDEHRTFDQTIIKIGRLASAHLQIDREDVARMHAVVEVEGDVVTVIDLGSSSGTFVNDERTNKKPLAPGDRIRIGGATIVLEPAPSKHGLMLPSPEIVRAQVGPSFAPSDVFGVAALVLRVDGVRRNAWTDETELAEHLFEVYPRGAVPAPELVPESRSFKTIDDAEQTKTKRCSTCIIRPGFSPCAVCVGTGAGSNTSDAADTCYACQGNGFISCSTCDGTTKVVACSIRYVNDRFVRVRRVIMPPVHKSIVSHIEARISADASWPSEHAFDPEPGMVASAYRGASAVRAAEDFHGFFFGDAIARCLAARAESTTGLARFETATFAIPILWTVTGDVHAAWFFDDSGALQHVG